MMAGFERNEPEIDQEGNQKIENAKPSTEL
jgi:hypothetical protein